MENKNIYRARVDYVARLEDGSEYRVFLACTDRIKPDVVLWCITYDSNDHNSCSLYYNEGNYSKEELLKAGYKIVKEIVQVITYIEEIELYKG